MRRQIAAAQEASVRDVDVEITRLGIEHDGSARDLRLLADAPNRWPQGFQIDRGGEVINPTVQPYIVDCPVTGWRVPMVETRQVSERHGVILELVPDAAARSYDIRFQFGVDEHAWAAAKAGTVIGQDSDLFLVHNPNGDEVRVRIANRAKAYLYCLEVEDPNTGWVVPLAASWIISKNYRTAARLIPDHNAKRFALAIEMGVGDEALEAASRGTVDDEGLNFELDGRRHTTSMERVRGDVRLKGRYRDPEEETRDRRRFAECRNRYSENAANDLRPWEIEDIVPRRGDIFQERLYAIQWLTPDGRIFFTSAREEDVTREEEVESRVRANLADWQAKGLVPDSRIEPGDKTDEPIRTRGWRHWHHLFTPRHLLACALLRQAMIGREIREAAALGFCNFLDKGSRLSQWRVGHSGKLGVAPSADYPEHVFYNQALNPFLNYASRSFSSHVESFGLNTKRVLVGTDHIIDVLPASDLKEFCHLFITDPPYADAIQYDEITEYFIAWLEKSPPKPDWIWDSRRELAIQGESESFRRSMVEAYSAMAEHMPDNGFQIVMFTHQDVGVWADLAEILWAAGLRVTAGWCVATETESATRVGNYV